MAAKSFTPAEVSQPEVAGPPEVPAVEAESPSLDGGSAIKSWHCSRLFLRNASYNRLFCTETSISDITDTISLRSSILKYRYENGKKYYEYKAHEYWAPIMKALWATWILVEFSITGQALETR